MKKGYFFQGVKCGFWASNIEFSAPSHVIIVQVPRSGQCRHEERPTRTITVMMEVVLLEVEEGGHGKHHCSLAFITCKQLHLPN